MRKMIKTAFDESSDDDFQDNESDYVMSDNDQSSGKSIKMKIR